MDNNNGINVNNLDRSGGFKFSNKQSVSDDSIMLNRAKREKEDTKALKQNLDILNSSLIEMIKNFDKIDDKTKSQLKTQDKLMAIQTNINKVVSQATDKQADYNESLELSVEAAKALSKAESDIYDIKKKSAVNEEERRKHLEDLTDAQRAYRDILEETNEMLERNKKASKSLAEGFGEGLKNLKNDVAQIATITGLDSIYNNLSGSGGQLATYNNMRSQFNMSKSDFNTFKRDIFTSIKENGNLTKYGFKDALEYMNRLGELGITDQEMARDQMDAIMLSTKYLGMSADTQAKILKQARNTGNMDLLNETNQTMVQIMNAQLGVAKDQLDAIVNQSTTMADLSVMFSGNKEALQNFTKSASALESVYGQPASKATMDIASDLLNNGGNSKYIGVLGQSYNSIISKLQSGDGSALYDILQAVKTSNVSRAGASDAQSWAEISGSGFLDLNTAALYNANQKNGTSYANAMESINRSSNDTNKFLKDMQLDFKSMLENVTSWISAWLPLDSLQTIYYTLAIADLSWNVGKHIVDIFKVLGTHIVPGIKDMLHIGKGVEGAMGTVGSNAGLLGGMSGILSALGVITSAIWLISDGVSGIHKAEEWNTSSLSALVGGILGGTDPDGGSRTLKNAGKWATIGGTVGMFLGHPLIGAALGGLFGTLTGAIGGKNIAQALGDANAPISGSSYVGSAGMGGPLTQKDFPWYLSSPFGYRGSISTKAGKTNAFHNGIDLAVAEGTPIGANNSGTVSLAGTYKDGANYVIINSGDGYEQVYWHLMKPSHLKKGDKVSAGQLIGYVGQTGQATGPHLHFGLRKANTYDYINPINSVNSELFNVTDNGVSNLSVWLPGMDEEAANHKYTTTLTQKMVDYDTISKESQAVVFDGIGGSGDVVTSVNSGFDRLIEKIDDLSTRQDEQEEMLKMIAQGKGTNLYKY